MPAWSSAFCCRSAASLPSRVSRNLVVVSMLPCYLVGSRVYCTNPEIDQQSPTFSTSRISPERPPASWSSASSRDTTKNQSKPFRRQNYDPDRCGDAQTILGNNAVTLSTTITSHTCELECPPPCQNVKFQCHPLFSEVDHKPSSFLCC